MCTSTSPNPSNAMVRAPWSTIYRSSCVEIAVHFLGKEEVHWVESDSESSTNYDNKHDFLSQKLILKSVQQTLPPGDHVSSFEHQLPSGLPGSFDNDKARDIDARIEYFVKGMVSITGPAKSTLEKEYKIIVSSPVPATGSPTVEKSTRVSSAVFQEANITSAQRPTNSCTSQERPLKSTWRFKINRHKAAITWNTKSYGSLIWSSRGDIIPRTL
ncbi:hypothetical protein AC1031_006165 [Aphanomyces cochlioides]|nr:hypothetical protein AC1031_006165 [Aphanomyces cochlioides]